MYCMYSSRTPVLLRLVLISIGHDARFVKTLLQVAVRQAPRQAVRAPPYAPGLQLRLRGPGQPRARDLALEERAVVEIGYFPK